MLAYALRLRCGGCGLELTLHVLFKISLQWHQTLNAVLGYALALRGGGSGLELTLHVLINVVWQRYQ
ncbi:hypothetical protein T11_9237 [Trichinella zimbabwensis]|uniref:Uncharacterized protein n=1 Tax=Trichinella zimbabwensis TaxID=268475 RepID=A0A0V1HII3_9BILA|nr:hypothetical protein T11_9237 [Trichinella zimbabwensis]